MRVFVCGASGKRIPQALTKLHDLFGITEVIHGASQRRSGVDLAASGWVDINNIPYRILQADRMANHIPEANPDLILLATTTGNSHAGVKRWANQLTIPVCIVALDGILHTSGKGWGKLLRRFIRREVTEVRLRKVAG